MRELNGACEVWNDEYLSEDVSSAEVIRDPATDGVQSTAEDVSGFNRIICGSSEDMGEIADQTVHLIVTSPPYCVGKEYETEQSFEEWLILMKKVCAEMRRVLVPGGRACINVAGIGRNPYRPTHYYETGIMLELGFLMRGEIIWNKGASAGGSSAWGSWMSASNPVLRDTHEYVLIFSKERMRRDRTGKNTIGRDQFLEYTKSIWSFPTESARRVGHPSPFPVELPKRLIELYSFEGDIVLDPFCGSGTTCVAAVMLKRQFLGCEIIPEYCAATRKRISEVLRRVQTCGPTSATTGLHAPRRAHLQA
jgi:site-specific DNA-methyltransferase (adenine-specific)